MGDSGNIRKPSMLIRFTPHFGVNLCLGDVSLLRGGFDLVVSTFFEKDGPLDDMLVPWRAIVDVDVARCL